MLGSDGIRGYNDTMILSILRQGDSYGYAISQQIARRTGGVYTMKETTLYSAINRLEKSGYLSSYSGTESHGKPRTYFPITPAGERYFQEKCKEWKLTKQVVDLFAKEETI